APVCDVATHACVGCLADADCPSGSLCASATSTCVPGCNAQHGCPSGRDCCAGACVNLQTDVDHCGACANVCDAADSQGRSCGGGACAYTGCASGYDDCDQAAPNTNGCETHVNTKQRCGSCGNACGAGTDCCGLACTTLYANPNCGSCGNTCGGS